MREDHERVGHDAKVVAVMLAFVVQLAANGRKEAAVAHYKAYLEAITTDPDYQEQVCRCCAEVLAVSYTHATHATHLMCPASL
jgi:hypothetical protein